MIFDVHILGSGSALPKLHRSPTAQYINVLERHLLIDCGEGTQIQMQRFKVKPQRIDHVLISHLHGDHYFGLMGLLSSMHLNGRTKELNLYGPPGLMDILALILHHGKTTLGFDLKFKPLESKESELIFEDASIEIHTIPLEHRIYCNGFLIREKKKVRRISKEAVQKFSIPVAAMQHLLAGEDYLLESGMTLINSEVTLPPPQPRSYAYCSDTKYSEKLIPLIEGVDLLYHEATFLKDKSDRAKKTFHSTANQAAQIAALAGVRKLLLGHFSARYDVTEDFVAEASTVFGNVTAVQDGDKYSIEQVFN